MRAIVITSRRLALTMLLIGSIVGLTGCSGVQSAKHKVQGQLVFADGSVQQLSGHLIEIAATDDYTQRASGVIDQHGRFTLETLDQGEVKPGVNAGQYMARLLIVDEGDGQTKKPKIAKKYLNFQTAGWKVQVPNSGEVQFTVTTK